MKYRETNNLFTITQSVKNQVLWVKGISGMNAKEEREMQGEKISIACVEHRAERTLAESRCVQGQQCRPNNRRPQQE